MTTPLILLHGFLGNARDWEPVIERIGAARRCIAFNLPGHGRASEPVPKDWAAVIGWLHARITDKVDGPADVLGYSLGGRLALGLAVEHPEQVRRVIAVGASTGIDDDLQRVTRRAEDERRARTLETTDFEGWLRDWYGQPLFETLRAQDTFETMLARRLRARPAELAKVLRVLSPGKQPPLGKRLVESAVPLLLMAGAEDVKYAASNRNLASQRPSIEAVTVPRAGHAPHLEQPDEFAHAVRRFLEQERDLDEGPDGP